MHGANPTSLLGRRWSRALPLPTPFFLFGEGFTLPLTPLAHFSFGVVLCCGGLNAPLPEDRPGGDDNDSGDGENDIIFSARMTETVRSQVLPVPC